MKVAWRCQACEITLMLLAVGHIRMGPRLWMHICVPTSHAHVYMWSMKSTGGCTAKHVLMLVECHHSCHSKNAIWLMHQLCASDAALFTAATGMMLQL